MGKQRRRILNEAALQELADSVVRINEIPREYESSVRELCVRSLDAPDLRQHPEWFLIEEWVEAVIPDNLIGGEAHPGFLTCVKVGGLLSDGDDDVEEWWADVHDEQLDTVSDSHRLQYLDEYVRQFAHMENEYGSDSLARVELVLPDSTVLAFNYLREHDETFHEGTLWLAKAGESLEDAVHRCESKGLAVGWHTWLSRPPEERLRMAQGHRRRNINP